MDVVKKNLLSIIFGVIAILAVVAVFWPIEGMYTKLQSGDPSDQTTPNLDAEAKKFGELNQLLTAKRQLPIMPALGSKADSAVQYLVDGNDNSIFPNEPVIAAAQQAVNMVHQQSLELVKAAEACNVHQPLVPNVLPDVPSTLSYDFQKAYQEKFRIPRDASDPAPTSFWTQLNATMPPTDEQIKAAQSEMYTKQYFPQIYTINGQQANKAEVDAEFNQAKLLVPIQMRDEGATTHKIYVLPDAISEHPALTKQETPSPEQVWFAQQSLWVEQDVVDSIVEANKDADNVTHSAVKRIVRLDVPQDSSVYVTANDGNNGGAKPDVNANGGPDYLVSSTGRVCNPLYDVVRFQIVLDVDATRLPAILADLERNKLLTVQQVDASSVDSAQELDNGFVYGKDPVVEVTLNCEELFLTSWLDPLMPDTVKRLLHGGGGPGGAPVGGGGPGAFGPGGGGPPFGPHGNPMMGPGHFNH